MKEKCKRCNHPSKGCIPYLMTLSTPELCDWCRMWKDRFGWTNTDVAEMSHVPKGSVDRVLGHNDKGVKLYTIRPIICAIVGCTVEELEACEKETGSIAELEHENAALKEALKNKDSEHKEDTKFLRSQIRQKNVVIAFLGLLLFVAVGVIIVALVIDNLNPEVGFFWIEKTIAAFHGSEEMTASGIDNIISWKI